MFGDIVNTSGIYIEETYAPSEQAIASLNFSYSVNHFDTTTGTETGVLPALLQDGRLFLGPLQTFSDNTWISRSQTGLISDDFVAADVWFTGAVIHPDFSAFGETIQFGYSLQNNVASGFAGFEGMRGVDNWSVTITEASLADIDGDGVDGTDLEFWSAGFGKTEDVKLVNGDFNRDQRVDGADFLKWQRSFGATTADQVAAISAVPEPHSLCLLGLCGLICCTKRSRK